MQMLRVLADSSPSLCLSRFYNSSSRHARFCRSRFYSSESHQSRFQVYSSQFHRSRSRSHRARFQRLYSHRGRSYIYRSASHDNIFATRPNSLLRWFRAIQKCFSPNANHCLACRRLLSAASILCPSCAATIPWIQRIQCQVCGRPEPCEDCKRRRNHYLYVNRSAVRYDLTMKQWLARFKYRGDEQLHVLFVEMLEYAFERLLQDLSMTKDQIDAVTYVPLSREREEERGFNQAKMLAEGLAVKANLPLVHLLERTRHSEKQSYMSRKERMASLQNTFAVRSEELQRLGAVWINKRQQSLIQPKHKGKENFPNAYSEPCLNIIIVDDIYTTGNTLNQNAKAIMQHLPAKCYGLTWARS